VLVPSVVLAAVVVSGDYEALIRRYAAGEQAAAVSALATWRAGELDRQVRALQRAARDGPPCPSCPHALDSLPLKAAVMLHVDRDEVERPRAHGTEQPRLCPGDHARRAGQIAAILAARDGPRDFARRFFLAMAHRSQWDFCLDAAQQWARDGLARFPRDPSLLLALGAALEEKATLGAVPPGPPRIFPLRRARGIEDPGGDRTSWFGEAERILSEAVTADPRMVEARIRLGRVQWRLRKDDLARRTLEEAIRLGGAPPLPHLAHLFLGQVFERGGRAKEAARAFEEALALEPESQAAAVALSHLRLSSGDAAGARRVLESALGHAGRRGERDPYWNYPASNAASADETLLALRREARE
jgi:tetratricopeptide (TPR) repeat protein